MKEARLIRRVRFTAWHHYGSPTLSPEENRLLFGEQVAPHGHDWLLEVEIVGPISEKTGYVVDLVAVDAALAALLEGWHGGDLNERVPEVRSGSMQPSTESLARWIHGRLAAEVPSPARLGHVWLWESDDLGARFPA